MICYDCSVVCASWLSLFWAARLCTGWGEGEQTGTSRNGMNMHCTCREGQLLARRCEQLQRRAMYIGRHTNRHVMDG